MSMKTPITYEHIGALLAVLFICWILFRAIFGYGNGYADGFMDACSHSQDSLGCVCNRLGSCSVYSL